MKKTIPSGAKTLLTFPVLWEGWECDSEGRVCEFDGVRFLVLTNHGSPYRAEVQELHDKLAEYRNVIAATEKAIELLSTDHPK